MIKQQLDQDLKTALLSKDTVTSTVIRSMKSAVLYAEVAAQKRDEGLSDDEVIAVFQKEAKKRQESADMYTTAGDAARAQAELAEQAIIARYLPEPTSEDEIIDAVNAIVTELPEPSMQAMGQVIGRVKQIFGARADGATIARLVKERLSKN